MNKLEQEDYNLYLLWLDNHCKKHDATWLYRQNLNYEKMTKEADGQ